LVSKGFGIMTVYTLVISIYMPLPGHEPSEPMYTMILPTSLMKFKFQTYSFAQIPCSCSSTQIFYLHTDGLFDMTFAHTRRSYSRCLTDGVKRLTTQTCSYFHHQERLNFFTRNINPLNAELNPMCCLLELLGAHHFLHVSRIRVNHHRVFLCTYFHF